MRLWMVLRRVAAPLTVILALTAALHATVAIPTDLPDVVASATLIIRGRVAEARAFTDIANGPVMTAVTVTVTETLKGTADRSVTFRVHGGDLGRYRHVMVGSPTFATGDDAYVFLKRAPDGILWPVGMSAGAYKVSALATVSPPIVAGVTATTGAQIARGDSRRKPIGVGDFSGIVKLLLAVGPGGIVTGEAAAKAGLGVVIK